MPGRRVLILGSGDIGLIMARRLTLEGAEVLAVAEKLPYAGGLPRNLAQCLDDFDIPLYLSRTVTKIEGQRRVERVTTAGVDEAGRVIPGTETVYDCDTLILSVGLIPENELSLQAGVRLSPLTNGPEVDSRLQTSIPGVFACGNVLHVHDLVDYASLEAAAAARGAVDFAAGGAGGARLQEIPVRPGAGVRYVAPFTVEPGSRPLLSLRVAAPVREARLIVRAGEKLLYTRRFPKLQPAEMLRVTLKEAVPLDGAEVEVAIVA
jgi:NADPH-dependent 2,4-dienoyl-CoA reductase/sulfur reductase-like enzyme